MDERRQRYWQLHDFSSGHGLEVGPLHRTMVTRDEGDVSYVDVMDRDRLIAHYEGDPAVSADLIPEIDFWLIDEEGGTRTLVEATRAGAPFDWVMASHVIEHVPDVIGWLAEVAEVVVDSGRLVLAIPDRRYEFDVHRPATTVGQMLQAHHSKDQRPPVAPVYDHFSHAVSYDAAGVWVGELPTFADRIHTRVEAFQMVERTLGGHYVDTHVWLFTPESFVHQMQELRLGGLSSWVVEKVVPTPRLDHEFQAVLRRLPRESDTTAEVEDEVRSEAVRPTWVIDGAHSDGRTVELELRVADLEERVAGLRQRLRRKSRRMRRLRRQLAALTPPPPSTSIAGRARARTRAVLRAIRYGR